MDVVKFSKNVIEIGSAWAKGRGYSRAEGIAAMLEAVAKLEINVREDDKGVVFWSLPNNVMAKFDA